MMKNAFYFTSKALLVLKVLSFCYDFLVMYKKWLYQKDTVNFKIHDITTWFLPNISRSKNNQAMKFGQLTEYNMKNIFVEKLYTKYAGQTIPRPFTQYKAFLKAIWNQFLMMMMMMMNCFCGMVDR